VVELLGQPDLADAKGERLARLIDDVVDCVGCGLGGLRNYSEGNFGNNRRAERRNSL